ncbi:MAG: 4'-phosphopantetheinyl transferase superfamily protein [Ferruginibacter sp.]
MENEVLQIVSKFTGIPENELSGNIRIDRVVLKNSILVHRMYAVLAEAGFNVDQYHSIKTLADLEKTLSGDETNSFITNEPLISITEEIKSTFPVGIDIENVIEMPITDDFRTHEFYKQNFSNSEISYCILQSDPYASFCGLFSVKEAIVKADNSYKNLGFNKIVIFHSENNKPNFSGFSISISHSDTFSIAIAIKNNSNFKNPTQNDNIASERVIPWISIVALIVSLLALCIAIL